MGQVGYWIFNIANVITLFGMAMGTMVRSSNSISHLLDRNDRFLGQPAHPHLPPHSQASHSPVHNHGYLPDSLHPQGPQVLRFPFSLPPSLLVGVSSFGLIALVVSLLILFFYGVAAYGFKFVSSFWFPQRGHVLSNLGVFINSLAFSLMCLSQVVAIPAGMHRRST